MDKIKSIVIILIICFIVGFTAGSIYRQVEKFNKDYSARVSGRTTIDDFEKHLDDDENENLIENNKIDVKVGDLVTIGTEKFYVISSDDDSVNMITKYNLDVAEANKVYNGSGLQNENVLGTIRWSNINDSYGTVTYDKVNQYISDYVKLLNETYNINITGRLLTYEESKLLGCDLDLGDQSCANAPYWLYSSSYWIELANTSYTANGNTYDIDVSAISHPDNGKVGQLYEGTNDFENLGVRPVITISKEDLKKFYITQNDYEKLKDNYSSLRYIIDSKYIAVIDNANNLKLIDSNDNSVNDLYTFDGTGYSVYDASYKSTNDRLCIASKDGIYVFISNGLSGNDEKLYAIYYNPETNEKSELVMQNVMGEFEGLITCK